MSLKLVRLAAEIEESDEFHLARLLLLLEAAAGKNMKPVQGIMKLAKLDFLLRYPNCLVRALKALGKDEIADSIPIEERNTIEARMIRFRFGPWDDRYRRWIGLLVSRGLANTYLSGRTVNVKVTEKGRDLAQRIAAMVAFVPLAERSKIVSHNLGGYTATKLAKFIYDVFPEIIDMRWGDDIDL